MMRARYETLALVAAVALIGVAVDWRTALVAAAAAGAVTATRVRYAQLAALVLLAATALLITNAGGGA